ncbi:MAG TPA: GNAT family N-acetyltransferase, partial [Egibacteraceae bacterium]|nr:GNAT family N-acetyltransferase [Egibacteraceae bacterium]
GQHAAELPPLGEWVAATDERLPEWLRPFGGDALVAWDDDGRYAAGVGIKRHDEHGWEIAVGTEEHARGRGLARRLVATAASAIVARGKVPLYFHAMDNEPSARVADAAGFPDRGWRLLFVLPRAAEG